MRMPPEWAPHERTLMAWPCRRELWRTEMAAAKVEYAGVANAIAAFEPVTMVCASARDAGEAREALTGACEVVELELDDSWLRDAGPMFLTDPAEPDRRDGVHFGFNGWGGKFWPWEHDAAVGGLLAAAHADRVRTAPFVLEGGAIGLDGAGTLVTTEQCLLNPNRNPAMGPGDIEAALRVFLGVERVVWLGLGLEEDRDTDGHVDMVAAFTGAGALLLQSAPPGDVDHERMEENRARAEAAGLTVTPFPLLPRVEVAGEPVAATYLNLYVCDGAVVVPVAGVGTDEEAMDRIAAAFPARDVVGV